ncbi:hypothetical protein SAMN03097694_2405 [Janthinobacterium lividum]|uniref:PRTase-CE domain-containing protein n=1 Tax=Janthinobacterium lividum TaxID=29581 RepID=A0AB38CAB9_9BURK|nr:hypothetical protein [Janthinobacterium lividum]SFX48136.1 hypothetical protein SAMN03097694_2405 [Janthinobacterium lividum]
MANLNVQVLGQFVKIWSEKNWKFPTKGDSDRAFETFSQLLSELNEEEQQLLLELTRSYSRYGFTDYQGLLINAFSKINKSYLIGMEQVLLAPLLNPSDDLRRDAKSGHALLYPAEHVAIPTNENFIGVPVNALSTTDSISENLNGKATLVILLDDFIGSGDTAKNCVLACMDKITKNDRLIVVTLVAMSHAIAHLFDNYGILIVSGEISAKGIAANANIVNKKRAYQIIDGIEQKINVSRDYRRGYNKSEALISMMRTPDNTFPMYWCNRRDGGGTWPAPFPR